MYYIKKPLINLLIILFFIHGFVYFIYPQDLYDLSSPLKYIKYVLVLVILTLVLNKSSIIQMVLYLCSMFILLIINKMAVGDSFSIVSFLNYLIPVSIFFFYEGISKYINIIKVVWITYIIMTMFSYIEFFLLGGVFFRFADSGYRVVSIFINPNNFGIMTVLITTYLLIKIGRTSNFFRIAILLNSLLLIFLSGSRNAMIMTAFLCSIYLGIKLMKILKGVRLNYKMVTSFFIALPIFSLSLILVNKQLDFLQFMASKTRSLDQIDLFTGRFIQYELFFNQVDINFIFPCREIFSYADNLYLHLWGFYGFPILFLFLLFNIYLLIKTGLEKKRFFFLAVIIFLIMGLAENYLYLWPVGYIYWYIAAIIIKGSRAKKKLQ